MDLALKKIELINWLSMQDDDMIKKIEKLRKSASKELYENRMNQDIESKILRSELNIQQGQVYTQDEVRKYFKNKSTK
ncbi:MAG: hypothetical protein OEW75_14220 [Cyclobacteriaceae bacterium]|nr:hypothetical protein [Cyclobacteriaceae bacterium]